MLSHTCKWVSDFKSRTIHVIKIIFIMYITGPNGNDIRQPMYPGFERDVFKTVSEHFQRLKEPLLTFHLYEIFVSILGKWRTHIINHSIVTWTCDDSATRRMSSQCLWMLFFPSTHHAVCYSGMHVWCVSVSPRSLAGAAGRGWSSAGLLPPAASGQPS